MTKIKEFIANCIIKMNRDIIADCACSEFRIVHKELYKIFPKKMSCSLCKKETHKKKTRIVPVDTTSSSRDFVFYCKDCIKLNLRLIDEYLKINCKKDCSDEEMLSQLNNADDFAKSILSLKYKEIFIHSLITLDKERVK